MIITVEISYYPLTAEFGTPIDEFLLQLQQEGVMVEIGTMSTLITGEYVLVMDLLNKSMSALMEKYPSVFTLKISNTCTI